jgi:RNA polymerase sigma factor (sigma-70 family)
MPEHPWAECARAFLEGQGAAVSAVRRAVETVARRFSLPTREDRREVVQEALGRVVDAVRSGRYRGEASLSTFAHSVAHFTCVEHARRHRPDPIDRGPETLESHAAGPEASLLQAERARLQMGALSRLPSGARALLELIFVERLSYKEAGDRLGLSASAVKSRVHRYRSMLRRRLDRGEAGGG